MPNKSLANKLSILYNLMRLGAPTGYLLSFFPAMFGLMLAYRTPMDLLYIPIFFIGSVLTRSAGCIINDLIDQNLDKKVERTKNRPLASGAISSKCAILILVILLLCCLGILLSLTETSIYIGIAAFFMISLYPLMKRITYFPQVFLGMTFNLGCLIAYAAITNNVSMNAIILYLACGFWTVAYDTIYAFMDIKDDKKVGIKSTALFFEHMNYKAIIFTLYSAFIMLFMYATWNQINLSPSIAIILSVLSIIWIIKTLNIEQVNNCLVRFKANNYIGFMLFLGLLLEKL
jgi:4-hydroxybenzoate polyprenyltransferase